MLKRCLVLSLLVLELAGCMTQGSATRQDGPAYMQPGIGAPARQTDMFGNSFRR